MKTSLYLCLSLASVLSAPSLFASPHAFEDQENVVPRQVRLADGSLKHIKLHAHHLKSSPTSQAELMHMHARHKAGRLQEKLVQAQLGSDQEGVAAITARLAAHAGEVDCLAAQHVLRPFRPKWVPPLHQVALLPHPVLQKLIYS